VQVDTLKLPSPIKTLTVLSDSLNGVTIRPVCRRGREEGGRGDEVSVHFLCSDSCNNNIMYLPVLPFFASEPSPRTLGQASAGGEGESKCQNVSWYLKILQHKVLLPHLQMILGTFPLSAAHIALHTKVIASINNEPVMKKEKMPGLTWKPSTAAL
jgi:hypothetical protein